MPSDKTILQNEDTIKKFLKDSGADFDRYKSDRDSIGFDERMKVADGMWRCLRNRDLADSEQEDSSEAPTTRANIGSVRFFRMVAQKGATGYAVSSSVDVPFKYTTRKNPSVWGSDVEAASQSEIHNALARYAWKQGECDKKMYEFWHQAHKYCHVPVQVVWSKRVKHMAIKDMETGVVKWDDVETDVFPTFNMLHWSMVYADMYTPTLQDQTCVVVLSVHPWMDVQNGVKAGWFDEEKVAEIRENMKKYRWDGSEGAAFRKEQVTNQGESGYSPGESDLFLFWDVYRWAPIENGAYDEEAEYKLYWSTSVGNTLGTSIPVRMETDFDPDNEIPMRMIKVIPDDSDMLYHMSWSEAVRAHYSIESTLWEQAVDNNSGVNNAMLLYDSEKFRVAPTSLKYAPGEKHDVEDVENALKEFAPRDTNATTTQLIKLIQDEQGVGVAMNENMFGNAFGGRTSASENIAINRFSSQPNLAETSYILHQLMGLLGPKYKSYFQAFASPLMVKMIADEELDAPVYPEEKGYTIYGDFDVEMNVVDEFVEDYVQAGQELQLLQIVSGSPQLMRSESHNVDVGRWLSDILRRMRIKDPSAIVTPRGGVDARLRQREENREMKKTGTYIAPQDGEDHALHIMEVDAEIQKWKPLAGMTLTGGEAEGAQEASEGLEFAKYYLTQLLIPHREAHAQFQQQEAQSAQNIPAQQTPGQQSGNEVAGILGGVAGGQ